MSFCLEARFYSEPAAPAASRPLPGTCHLPRAVRHRPRAACSRPGHTLKLIDSSVAGRVAHTPARGSAVHMQLWRRHMPAAVTTCAGTASIAVRCCAAARSARFVRLVTMHTAGARHSRRAPAPSARCMHACMRAAPHHRRRAPRFACTALAPLACMNQWPTHKRTHTRVRACMCACMHACMHAQVGRALQCIHMQRNQACASVRARETATAAVALQRWQRWPRWQSTLNTTWVSERASPL